MKNKISYEKDTFLWSVIGRCNPNHKNKMDGIITFEQGKRTSEERRLMERAKWAQQKRDERIENNAGNHLGIGKHGVYTFRHVYENEDGYVRWCLALDRPSPKLAAFINYINDRHEQEKQLSKKRKRDTTDEHTPVPLPIVERTVKPETWKWNTTAVRHHRTDNPQELTGLEKNLELLKQIGHIFMPDYDVKKTTTEQLTTWVEKETKNGNIRVGCVKTQVDPNCEVERVDEDGILHTNCQYTCWCTTPIHYLCILTHSDRYNHEMIIGSTCFRYFSGSLSISEMCQKIMKRLKNHIGGLKTHCQNNECRKVLPDRRTWIRKNGGFCDNKCAGYTCEFQECEKAVALKSWKNKDYSDEWKSSYCCTDHYRLMNGWNECDTCRRTFKPKYESHSQCKSCYKNRYYCVDSDPDSESSESESDDFVWQG